MIKLDVFFLASIESAKGSISWTDKMSFDFSSLSEYHTRLKVCKVSLLSNQLLSESSTLLDSIDQPNKLSNSQFLNYLSKSPVNLNFDCDSLEISNLSTNQPVVTIRLSVDPEVLLQLNH